jgi:hypothetical protein
LPVFFFIFKAVTGHIDMTYGNNLLNGQAALFEPVQNQDDGN